MCKPVWREKPEASIRKPLPNQGSRISKRVRATQNAFEHDDRLASLYEPLATAKGAKFRPFDVNFDNVNVDI